MSAKGERNRRAAKPKRGRPLKLTRELIERIVQALKAGSHVAVAAEFAGISTTTFYRWLEHGRAEPDSIYGELCVAVRQAEAEAEVHVLATLRAAFAQRPDMILAWLARRHPGRWGASARDRGGHGDDARHQSSSEFDIAEPDVRAHLTAALEASRREHERAR